MKLKEYLENLQNLVKEKPEALEYLVISSIDSEGNGYNEVYYEPTLGFFDKYEKEFMSEESLEEEGYDDEINAVCIN